MKQKAIKSPALAAKRAKTAPQPAGRVLPPNLAAGPKVPTAPVNKQEHCLDLLVRRDGASLSELVTATGWQPHSVRGFLSGTVKKKLGLTLHSSRGDDGSRRYRVDRASRGC